MREMIAYCGLDCEQCDAYLATIHDDQELREKTAALWARLNNAPILPQHINFRGCRGDGIKTVYCTNLCAIRRCALERGAATCGECPEVDQCGRVGAIFAHRPDARKNLEGS